MLDCSNGVDLSAPYQGTNGGRVWISFCASADGILGTLDTLGTLGTPE